MARRRKSITGYEYTFPEAHRKDGGAVWNSIDHTLSPGRNVWKKMSVLELK